MQHGRKMSRLEKRLIIFALLFVVVYLAAIVLTIQSRIQVKDKTTRIGSVLPTEEEGRLALAQLLAPMAVLLTLAICFIVAKKQREKKYRRLDESNPYETERENDHTKMER